MQNNFDKKLEIAYAEFLKSVPARKLSFLEFVFECGRDSVLQRNTLTGDLYNRFIDSSPGSRPR